MNYKEAGIPTLRANIGYRYNIKEENNESDPKDITHACDHEKTRFFGCFGSNTNGIKVVE